MAALLLLSPEIKHMIVSYLSVKDLSSLIKSHKSFHEYQSYLLYRDALNGHAALLWAALNGYFTIAQAAVQASLEANAPISGVIDACGRTPLMLAAGGGHLTIIQLLLQSGLDANELCSYYGQSALHCAVQSGGIRTCIVLLQANANPNKTDLRGTSPLHIAARMDRPTIIDALLKHGANPDQSDDFGMSPLHEAAINNNIRAVAALLPYTADINSPSLLGFTPVTSAAMAGHPDVVVQLLAGGGDVNALDNAGSSPLHLASCHSRNAVITALSCWNAEIDMLDCYGETALHRAAQHGSLETICQLLDLGASVRSTSYSGITPLMYAAQRRCPSFVQTLLERGADADQISDEGFVAYTYASERSNIQVANLLFNHTSRFDSGTAARRHHRTMDFLNMLLACQPHLDETGKGILCLNAARSNLTDIVESVLSAVNIQAVDSFNMLAAAADNCNMELLLLLLKNGSQVNTQTPETLTAERRYIGLQVGYPAKHPEFLSSMERSSTPKMIPGLCHFSMPFGGVNCTLPSN
ncbi:hypothetical protein MY1884_001705 [Beauveria asiatica]